MKLSAEDWTTECQDVFDKHDLSHSVTLAHPDFGKPFILAVDALFDGIGAVLSQLQPGEKVTRPVAFANKTLSRAQLNYPAHRLEFLVCIDVWTAESSDKKSTDVLVMTHHFSKLALAFPCRNQSAKQVPRCLWDKFFCIYGFPK